MTGDALIRRLERIRERVRGTENFTVMYDVAVFELVPLLEEDPVTAAEYRYRTRYTDAAADPAPRHEQQYHRLRIESFERLHRLPATQRELSSEEVQAMDDVCAEMILFLKARPKTKGRRSKARFIGDNRLLYKKQEYILAKNSDYARLCKKVHEVCQDIGNSVDVGTLYNALRKTRHESDTVSQYNWVYQTMDSANRWAEGQDGLPQLFKMDQKKVVRLI